MKIFVFGNPDLAFDSLPLRILPGLKRCFPEHEFANLDPNEEWDIPESVTAIDTAVGISDVCLLEDLDYFEAAPRVTAHDFDALANLRLLHKLGKIKKIRIIGIPPDINTKKAMDRTAELLEKIVRSPADAGL